MRGVLARIGFVLAAVLLLLLVARCSLIRPHRHAVEPRDVATQSSEQQPPPEAAAPPPQPEAPPAPVSTAPAAAPPATGVPNVPREPEPAVPAPSAPAAAPPVRVAPTPTPSQRPPAAVEKPAPPQPTTKPATPPRPTAPATGATPAQTGHKGAARAAATTSASAVPLDLNRLKQELKDTKAIGFFSKLTLKNQMDDLLNALRKFHQGQGRPTLIDLRRSYELLVMKVLSLVQDDDKKLASDIVSSREALWSMLADPKKFAALQV